MVSMASEGWTPVRGDLVSHVEITLDGDGLERAVQEGRVDRALEEKASPWTSFVSRRLDLDVWVDGRGRQRRIDVVELAPEPAAEDAPRLRIIQEWWDFGGPGRLAAPSDLPAAPGS